MGFIPSLLLWPSIVAISIYDKCGLLQYLIIYILLWLLTYLHIHITVPDYLHIPNTVPYCIFSYRPSTDCEMDSLLRQGPSCIQTTLISLFCDNAWSKTKVWKHLKNCGKFFYTSNTKSRKQEMSSNIALKWSLFWNHECCLVVRPVNHLQESIDIILNVVLIMRCTVALDSSKGLKSFVIHTQHTSSVWFHSCPSCSDRQFLCALKCLIKSNWLLPSLLQCVHVKVSVLMLLVGHQHGLHLHVILVIK